MSIRPSIVADRFYEGEPESCRRHAESLLGQADLPDDLPETIYGGLAPHAGWIFSGHLAAMTIKALGAGGASRSLVLFGADHTGAVRQGEVFASGAWRTPLGECAVDEELASAVLDLGGSFQDNPDAHAREHSLEVEVPLIQVFDENLRILPIAVPPSAQAVEIGQAVGKLLAERFPDSRVLGSTDLTHHGGHFGAPGGRGKEGEEWTRRNDRRLLDRIETIDAEGIVPEATSHQNACGPGAIAATAAACAAMGATRGVVLGYTNSYEVVHRMNPGDPDDTTVGYASAVFV